MKKRIIILMILVSAAAFGGWDNARVTKPVQDLRDFLLPVPDATKYTYGNSDRTQVMWNILAITEICKGYEIELKALRAEVEGLKKQVAEVSDPNDAILYSEIKELKKEVMKLKEKPSIIWDPNLTITNELNAADMNSVPSVAK